MASIVKLGKRAFQILRQRAVRDYSKVILSYIDSTDCATSLLDCGCDDGRWTLELGRRLGNQVRLYGIEIVEEARRRALEKGIDARPGDLNAPFPFEDNCFDIVHANQVIEHLENTDSFISEIRRVLRPGGCAVICTENLSSWHNICSLLCGWQPFSLSNVSGKRFQIGNPLAIHSGETTVNPGSWQHMRVFAFRGLLDLFTEHGFVVVRCDGSGYYPLPGCFAKIDARHAAFLTLKVRKAVDGG